MNTKIVYDGRGRCHKDVCCPIAELDLATNMVTLYDLAKPENGRYTMTRDEYNAFAKDAQPIE